MLVGNKVMSDVIFGNFFVFCASQQLPMCSYSLVFILCHTSLCSCHFEYICYMEYNTWFSNPDIAWADEMLII
jgi:hypothetical protein